MKRLEFRITLRKLVVSDAEKVFVWTGDPLVTEPLFWDAHTDLAATVKFLTDVADHHPWFMAICLDGEPVGAITLDRGSGRAVVRAELGYVLARNHWGQGIATAAVRLALRKGFDDLKISRIEAFVDPDNKASIRVLEKAGLHKEGRLSHYVIHRGKIRDRFIYGVTK